MSQASRWYDFFLCVCVLDVVSQVLEFILGLECVTQLVRGKLLAQNVFYDPLLLDVGKPLCDESGDISLGDINHRKQQEVFGNMDFRILNRIMPFLSLTGEEEIL